MHASSYDLMGLMVEKYIAKIETLSILEIGSADYCGSYKKHFEKPNWFYQGADCQAGKNVDIIYESFDKWAINKRFDLVISGQVMEHVKDLHRFAEQVEEVCNKYIIMIAPNKWDEHKYPIDCWRIFPDGMKYLFEERLKFKTLECGLRGPDTYYVGEKNGSF